MKSANGDGALGFGSFFKSTGRFLSGSVEGLAGFAVLALVLLPLLDLVMARLFFRGIAPAGAIVDHAIVVLAFMAAASASRHGSHLSLAGTPIDEAETWEPGKHLDELHRPTAKKKILRRLRLAGAYLARSVDSGISMMYMWASLSLVFVGFEADALVWVIPTRILACAIPLGFLFMTAYAVRRPGKGERVAAVVGLLLGSFLASSAIANLAGALGIDGGKPLAQLSELSTKVLADGRLPLGILLGIAGISGALLFAVLGGLALVFLGGSGGYIEIAPSEAYALLRGSSIASLPLFALAGFLLAESGAGKRLVAVFRSFFGFLPGGEAIAAVVVCAFFTTFTGANGVTIIALGSLLAGILIESECASPAFARGLVAASGAIGLLLPPSAAVILYGINAQYIYGDGAFIDIMELFKGALLPGILLIASMSVMGVLEARKRGIKSRPFNAIEAKKALKPALLELATPLIAAGLYFTGAAGLTEIGAVTVLYLIIVEGLVKKELGFKELYQAFKKSLPVLGGTLAILAAARGLSFYLIDADVPNLFTNWVKSTATSPLLFLLLLNVALLFVGCMMDIFSAIIIAAPLVIPLGAAFGLNPIHLGVVFILNLCVGFLTPPVGMSLFLAGYAFKQPLSKIIKETLPFLFVQLGVLIIVTYIPGLTTVFLRK